MAIQLKERIGTPDKGESLKSFLQGGPLSFDLSVLEGQMGFPTRYRINLKTLEGQRIFEVSPNCRYYPKIDLTDPQALSKLFVSLGEKVRFEGTSPEEAFLNCFHGISSNFFNYYTIGKERFEVKEIQIPHLKWDLTLEDCYEWFQTPLPAPNEEPAEPVVTSPLVRRRQP